MNKQLIEKTFDKGEGIFRLYPLFIPRPTGRAGYRLRLHPDDYYAYGIERGSIKERWLSSTTISRNAAPKNPTEGLSFVAVDYASDEKFSLKEAVETLQDRLIGKELFQKYGAFPVFSKFFDYQNPLFFHVHLMEKDAARIGKSGKPEAYYFPKQLNTHLGNFPATYFGFKCDVKPEEVKRRLKNFDKEDVHMTELSIAYPIELGTGWFVPAGVIHAPASVLTYEPQWASDVTAVFENVVSGEPIAKRMLTAFCPDDKKDDIDYIFNFLDWEKNITNDFKKTYFRAPVEAVKTDAYCEKWITYGNDLFSAKEITINPNQTVIIKDPAAYGIVFFQGHGKFGSFTCEAPTALRFGQQSADEFFVSADAAKKGVQITNLSPIEPLTALKHFGPDNIKK